MYLKKNIASTTRINVIKTRPDVKSVKSVVRNFTHSIEFNRSSTDHLIFK